MNKLDRGILIGMVLGDGYLHVRKLNRGTNCYCNRISLLHGKKQKEYIEYKASLLHSIFGGKAPSICIRNNNGYTGYAFQKSNSYFRILHKWIYKDNVKTFSRNILNKLTLQGIAIWYMDDGSLYAKKRNGKIHAYELILSTYTSQEQNQIIIEYFRETYNIEFKMVRHHQNYRLRLATKEARKFIDLIKKYSIPSMEYKFTFN